MTRPARDGDPPMHDQPSPTRVRSSAATGRIRSGFTIVELLVVAVIIALLAALTLAGLSRVRHRAKVDKTKSTIRKIHEVIVPQYESYLRRRVPFATSGNARQNATNRLVAIRRLMVREMPDNWNDVFDGVAAVNVLSGSNAYLATGPVRAYAAAKTPARIVANGSAECLYMSVAFGGQEPYVMEQFRPDEIGDTDLNGSLPAPDEAPEFLDGWGQPIVFLRWAPGFSPLSIIQVADATTYPDPFDPQRVDAAGYALTPLIVSGGSDRVTGLQITPDGWAGLNLQSIVGVAPQIGEPVSAGSGEYRDNITYHDFSVK